MGVWAAGERPHGREKLLATVQPVELQLMQGGDGTSFQAGGMGLCRGSVQHSLQAELRAWGREGNLSVPAWAMAALAMGKSPAQDAWGRWSERQNGSIHQVPDLSSVPHPAPISTRAPPGQ